MTARLFTVKTKLLSWMGLSVTVVLAASVVLSQARAERTSSYEELPNFHQVNEKLEGRNQKRTASNVWLSLASRQ